MNDLILIKHNLTNYQRDQALKMVPDIVKECAKQGILILSTPECEFWIGKKVEPFDVDTLEVVKISV